MSKQPGPNPGLLFIIAGCVFFLIGFSFKSTHENQAREYAEKVQAVKTGQAEQTQATIIDKRSSSSGSEPRRTSYYITYQLDDGTKMSRGVNGVYFNRLEEGEQTGIYLINGEIFLPKEDNPGRPAKTFRNISIFSGGFVLFGVLLYLIVHFRRKSHTNAGHTADS